MPLNSIRKIEKKQHLEIINNLINLLNCDVNDLNKQKISDLDQEIRNKTQNIVKKYQDLLKKQNQENNYPLIKKIDEYCVKVNNFFNFINDILSECSRANLQFTDPNIRKETVALLKKINNDIRKTKIESCDEKTMYELYQEIINVLRDYKEGSSTNLIHIVEKVNKLNNILKNKNVTNDSNDSMMINFSTSMNKILGMLEIENKYHKNRFLNNFLFKNFYLIYGFGVSYKDKANISVKKMLETDLKNLYDKMNDLPENVRDMTPIKQFISGQSKNLDGAIKQYIWNLHEEN